MQRKKEHIGFTQLKEMMPTLFSNNNDNILKLWDRLNKKLSRDTEK